MIFVTVGTQQPFDRLIAGVDRWAARCARKDILAQIGVTTYRPCNIQAVRFMSPVEYRNAVEGCAAMVAHAGMGSIITALEYGKPIIVMPKREDLHETRGGHQLATARLFCPPRNIPVVLNDDQLFEALDSVKDGTSSGPMQSTASPELLNAIRKFIATN